jgi:hypothetical protein
MGTEDEAGYEGAFRRIIEKVKNQERAIEKEAALKRVEVLTQAQRELDQLPAGRIFDGLLAEDIEHATRLASINDRPYVLGKAMERMIGPARKSDS